MSDRAAPVELVFLWHHHQPDYRNPRDGHAVLPWVWLHASKDYLDMAEHLRRHPGVHATFNFVPSLLDQLEDAERGVPEALFELLSRPPGSLDEPQRTELLTRCTVSPRYAIERWPAYRRLCERAARARTAGGTEVFGDDDMLALEIWFLVAWVDPLFHDRPAAVAVLAPQATFDLPRRDGLLALHRELLAEVIPSYRALADRGQIELSESPYYHPILPLLINQEAARRPRPDVLLPSEPFAAPEDAALQVERGVARHERAFGRRPAGMWPPEGGVSPEAVELIARAGLRWAASDEGVLWGSLPPGEQRREALYHPWRVDTAAGPLAMFFRDHELSDRIGFVYSHWNAADAVADFLGRVRRVARDHAGDVPPVVSVILDGENCWEHYADDGAPFLEALYAELEAAADIRTRTPSEVLAERASLPVLERLYTGSWIQADFRIWIGHPEKNRAWELVSRARRALVNGGRTLETHPKAWEALFAAEGSDWFWWFGEDHYTADKILFDKLFRDQLQAVYERAELPTPGWLQIPVTALRDAGVTRIAPVRLLTPVLDGRRTNFYEWEGAGHHRLGGGGGSMHRDQSLGRDLYFGFDLEQLHLRIDFAPGVVPKPDLELAVELLAPRPRRIEIDGIVAGERMVVSADADSAGSPTDGLARPARPGVPGATCIIGSILELSVPFAALGVTAGDAIELLVHVLHGGQVVETFPADDLVRFKVPDRTFESAMWSA